MEHLNSLEGSFHVQYFKEVLQAVFSVLLEKAG